MWRRSALPGEKSHGGRQCRTARRTPLRRPSPLTGMRCACTTWMTERTSRTRDETSSPRGCKVAFDLAVYAYLSHDVIAARVRHRPAANGRSSACSTSAECRGSMPPTTFRLHQGCTSSASQAELSGFLREGRATYLRRWASARRGRLIQLTARAACIARRTAYCCCVGASRFSTASSEPLGVFGMFGAGSAGGCVLLNAGALGVLGAGLESNVASGVGAAAFVAYG
jgi:hypothetical protein